MIGMMTVMPVFTRLGINGLVRNVSPRPRPSDGADDRRGDRRPATGPPAFIAALLFKEATVGSSSACCCRPAAVGAEFAAMCWTAARILGRLPVDPSGAQASVTGSLFALVMMAL